MGEAVKVRVAYKGVQPVAAIFTIRHKDTVVYKYGCSDAAQNKLGGMHLLLWKTIEEGKRDGLRTLDLGRSDPENEGLIRFKDRWGSRRTSLCYSRFTSAKSPKDVYSDHGRRRKERVWLNLFSHLPDSMARWVGGMLYRHIG
jgi:hypothetical protein